MKKIRKDWAAKAAEYISYWAGSRYALLSAIALLIIWVISGRFFDYSEGWQIVLTIGSAVISFLMVFIIQTTQNRNAKIIRIKLDELLRSTHGANSLMMGLEDFTEEELESIRDKYEEIADETRKAQESRHESGVIEALFHTEIDRSLHKKPVIKTRKKKPAK